MSTRVLGDLKFGLGAFEKNVPEQPAYRNIPLQWLADNPPVAISVIIRRMVAPEDTQSSMIM